VKNIETRLYFGIRVPRLPEILESPFFGGSGHIAVEEEALFSLNQFNARVHSAADG
jgi:hypothetical protein